MKSQTKPINWWWWWWWSVI